MKLEFEMEFVHEVDWNCNCNWNFLRIKQNWNQNLSSNLRLNWNCNLNWNLIRIGITTWIGIWTSIAIWILGLEFELDLGLELELELYQTKLYLPTKTSPNQICPKQTNPKSYLYFFLFDLAINCEWGSEWQTHF